MMIIDQTKLRWSRSVATVRGFPRSNFDSKKNRTSPRTYNNVIDAVFTDFFRCFFSVVFFDDFFQFVRFFVGFFPPFL